MKSANDLWEDLGSLAEDEMFHVVTKLFAIYENDLQRNPDSREALNFMKNLANVIEQTTQCNSNRR